MPRILSAEIPLNQAAAALLHGAARSLEGYRSVSGFLGQNRLMSTPAFRVVVADDSKDMRELITAALEASGRFEVVGHGVNGTDALDAVRGAKPDLALLDLGMPGVGGMDVLPELVRACPTTRVIVVSGFPRGRLAKLALGHGAVGYVEKGLSAKAMVDEIVAVAGLLEAVAWALEESRTSLELDPRSSAAARRFVEETLRRWECDAVLDTVNLLVSELVTNSVVHAASAPDVAVLLRPRTVRIEVSDRTAVVPEARALQDEDTSGRGLAMVEMLSSAWGVDPTPQGKTIWFEIDRPDQMPRR